MELLKDIIFTIQFVTNDWIIVGISIATIMLWVLQRHVTFKKYDSLFIIMSSIVAVYGTINLIMFLIGLTTINNSTGDSQWPFFLNRMFGPYWLAYWVMLVSSTILPMLLWIPKIASKKVFIIIIAALVNIGPFYEWFVIYITSLHRGFMPSTGGYSIWPEIMKLLVHGLVLSVLLLLGLTIYERYIYGEKQPSRN